jgi:hypothetical protein
LFNIWTGAIAFISGGKGQKCRVTVRGKDFEQYHPHGVKNGGDGKRVEEDNGKSENVHRVSEEDI